MCTSWSSVSKCMRRRNALQLSSGSFVKYGDYWKRDRNIGPKIPRPFPVARTQIVELVLLFIPCWFWRGSGVADERNLCWWWVTLIVGFSVFVVLILILAVEVGQILSLTLIINVDVGSNLIGWILHLYGFHRPLWHCNSLNVGVTNDLHLVFATLHLCKFINVSTHEYWCFIL